MRSIDQTSGRKWGVPAVSAAAAIACILAVASCGGRPPPETALKGAPAQTASNDPPNLADLLERATNSRAPGAVADTGKKPKHEARAAVQAQPQPPAAES